MITAKQCSELYIQACELELQAFKPGNVSVYSDGHDMTVADFRISAAASATAVSNPDYSLGEKIYYAVKASREAVHCNTNLGIILLCAPVIQATLQQTPTQTLQESLALVLANTTIEDANWVFKAIRLASPGGLGESSQADVNQNADITLLQAMELAADKDKIAYQYTHCFKDIFDFAFLQYNHAFVLSGDSGWATLVVYCEMLARFPDSHIERKYGKQYSEWVAAEMKLLCNELKTAIKLEDVLPSLYRVDKAFKAKNINPGTTADLTVAALLVIFLDQITGKC